jgi:predicted O-methyltransferase YrrM
VEGVVILFGTCVGFAEKLTAQARPGLTASMSEPYEHFAHPSNGKDIFPVYAGLLEVARDRKPEAFVLMHDDLEFRDPDLAAKVRHALSAPSVAIVGLIGSRGAKGLAWWEGERAGRVEDIAYGLHDFGFDRPDVDTLDGMCLVLSPWAIENLTLDGLGYSGFHGYADELCAQARAKGKRVVVADIKAFHHSKGGYAGGMEMWAAANQNFRKRWAHVTTREALIDRIRAAGTDSLADFGNGYTHEGGLGLQQNPEELADFILLLKGRPHETYLEIGSASGGMAHFLRDQLNVEVSSIDDGKHPRHGEHRIEHQLVADSHSDTAKAWVKDRKFDVTFIDGDHEYAGVKQDIELAMACSKLIAVHDTIMCPDVARAWNEVVATGKIREIARFAGKEVPLGIAVGEVRDPWAPVRKPPPWDVDAMFAEFRNGPVSAQPHVMLATPAYNPPGLEFINIRDMVARDLQTNAIACTTLTSPGDSLVMRGRHTLMAEFLKSDCTHLLFWDVDIEPKDPSIVRQMLATGHDIIGGACPFRSEGGGVVCNIRQVDKDRGMVDTDDVQCVEVSEVGTGFLLMSRKAIVRMCEAYPDLMYFSDLPTGYGEPMWSLFDTIIVDRRFLSEDYFFCKLWKDMGGTVHVYVPFEARHWGRKGFEASIAGALNMRPPA